MSESKEALYFTKADCTLAVISVQETAFSACVAEGFVEASNMICLRRDWLNLASKCSVVFKLLCKFSARCFRSSSTIGHLRRRR